MRIVKEWLGYCNMAEVNPRSLAETKHNKWWGACVCQDDEGQWLVHSLFAALGNKPMENIERYTKTGRRELLTEQTALALLDELVREKTSARKGYTPVAFDTPFGSPLQVKIPSFVQILQPGAGRGDETPWWLPLEGARRVEENGAEEAGSPGANGATPRRSGLPGAAPVYCSACGEENEPEARFCTSCGVELAAGNGVETAAEEEERWADPSLERPASRPPTPVPPTEMDAAPPVAPLTVHRAILKHRYRLSRQLGEGAYGMRYQGKDLRGANRSVLIQQLAWGAALLEGALLLDALTGLTSRHLPRVIDLFTDAGRWFLVIEDLEGEPLATVLARRKGLFPPVKVLSHGLELCTLIEDLWRAGPPPLVYALQPAHLLLTAAGRLYLGEFGLAPRGLVRSSEQEPPAPDGSPEGGTAGERPGEGERRDIRQAGALLYLLLTRQPPPAERLAGTPTHRSGQVATGGRKREDELPEVLVRMMRAEVDEQPIGLEEIRQHFQRLLAEQG